MKNILSVVGLVIVFVAIASAAAYFSSSKSAYPEAKLVALAQALAAKGVTMYGAEWCPHCKVEKARFGAAWKYVPYVECPQNEKICLDKGIRGYPTWITASGERYEGEQGLEKLAQIAGFQL